MRKPSRKTVYADAGIQYDELWPRDQKVAWNRAHRRLLRPILAGAKSVCELGCGTGNRACEFARRGVRVYAVDLSAAMLWAARQKARRENLPIHFMQAEMRSFRLPQRVDLINSERGAVNHIPRKTDLPRVARAVSRALRPGGYFVFDVNHRRVFDDIWAETDIRETSKLFMVQRGGYDQRRGKGWLEVTWFVPGRRGAGSASTRGLKRRTGAGRKSCGRCVNPGSSMSKYLISLCWYRIRGYRRGYGDINRCSWRGGRGIERPTRLLVALKKPTFVEKINAISILAGGSRRRPILQL